jgi:hypothetical protein
VSDLLAATALNMSHQREHAVKKTPGTLRHLATLTIASTVLLACSADLPTTARSAPNSRAPRVTSLLASAAVMSNLNSPRGLAFAPNGALYVAEAGTTVSTGACAPVLESGAIVTKCYSGTGSISRYWKGQQQRVATGLPSAFTVQSGFASGPSDISFTGLGSAYVPIGFGGDPAVRSQLGDVGMLLGTLVRVEPSGQWRTVADVSAFESLLNPAGGPVDSNPYGVLSESDTRYVVDAGGNSLLAVSPQGQVSLVAIFPTTPAPPPFNSSEAVPTKVERGPDGALYVSTLSGAPFLNGSAGIYRVVPGAAPELYVGGVKTITDFTFAPDGSIYVVQFATSPLFLGGPGALIRVAPDGTRSTITTELFRPTGVAVGPDGAIYVSNNGTTIGSGEVLKITLTNN